MQIGPGGVQDGPKIVLVRSFFRLVVRDRFFGRFGVVLGSFLGAPGVVLVLFRHFNSSIQPVNSSTRRFNASTHQLINSSTHGPSALSYPARRTARCAIKSAATRRVGACLNGDRIVWKVFDSRARPRAARPSTGLTAKIRPKLIKQLSTN